VLGLTLLSRWRAWETRPAFVEGERAITYGALARQALGWAAYCRERGWGAGDCVAARLANGPVFASLFAGLALRGAALLPLNTQWPPGEVARRLVGKPLAGVIADGEHLATWAAEPAFARLPQVDVDRVDVDRVAADTSGPSDGGDHDALYLMTSGTTGQAKLVVRTQAQLLANAANVGRRLQWEPGCPILPVTPFFHANGFSNGLLLPLLAGACVVLLARFFPARLLELVQRHRVQVLLASPVVYASLVRAGAPREAWASLGHGLSSGAPLPPSVATQAAAQGLPLRDLYGSSETGTISIAPPGPGGATVGVPIEHVEVRILSPAGEPLPTGQVGLVAVRGPAVMKGYWRAAGVEPARDAQGFFLTGDLGSLAANGELSLHGRVRPFINVGGNKVSPEVVERVLMGLPGILRCQVSGVAHPHQGQVVAATIILRPGVHLGSRDVLAHCRRHLAEHEAPRQITIETYRAGDLPDKHSLESP
jgi:acyl-CoA synthetase (AMP-forming)/AMP-acid ligase II